MTRRHFSLSQVVAWTVPFLIILLLIRTAPALETIVHNHVEIRSAPTVTTTPSSKPTSTPTTSVPRTKTRTIVLTADPPVIRTPTTTVVTSTTVVSSASSTGGTVKRKETNGTTATTTTTTTIAPVNGPGGVLTSTNSQVDVNIPVGAQWTLSSNGSLTWSTVCSGQVDQTNPPVITGPTGAYTCYLDIQSNQIAPVTWQLTDF